MGIVRARRPNVDVRSDFISWLPLLPSHAPPAIPQRLFLASGPTLGLLSLAVSDIFELGKHEVSKQTRHRTQCASRVWLGAKEPLQCSDTTHMSSMIEQQCGLDASAPVIRIARPVALSSVTGLWPASSSVAVCLLAPSSPVSAGLYRGLFHSHVNLTERQSFPCTTILGF